MFSNDNIRYRNKQRITRVRMKRSRLLRNRNTSFITSPDINECDETENRCNGGECINDDGGYRCICSEDFKGVDCQYGS